MTTTSSIGAPPAPRSRQAPQAQRLRDLAAAMILSGRNPLVTGDDWQQPPTSS